MTFPTLLIFGFGILVTGLLAWNALDARKP